MTTDADRARLLALRAALVALARRLDAGAEYCQRDAQSMSNTRAKKAEQRGRADGYRLAALEIRKLLAEGGAP